jgi:hypothetical protein
LRAGRDLGHGIESGTRTLPPAWKFCEIAAWLRVYGMISPAPGFNRFPQVLNGASELIQEVFGPEVGDHTRTAVGVAALPWNVPVEIEAEVELA